MHSPVSPVLQYSALQSCLTAQRTPLDYSTSSHMHTPIRHSCYQPPTRPPHPPTQRPGCLPEGRAAQFAARLLKGGAPREADVAGAHQAAGKARLPLAMPLTNLPILGAAHTESNSCCLVHVSWRKQTEWHAATCCANTSFGTLQAHAVVPCCSVFTKQLVGGPKTALILMCGVHYCSSLLDCGYYSSCAACINSLAYTSLLNDTYLPR